MNYLPVRKSERGFYYYESPRSADVIGAMIDDDLENVDYQVYLAGLMPPISGVVELSKETMAVIQQHIPMLNLEGLGRQKTCGQYVFSVLATEHKDELLEMLDKEPPLREFFDELTKAYDKSTKTYYGDLVALIGQKDELMLPAEWRTVPVGEDLVVYTRLPEEEAEKIIEDQRQFREKVAQAHARERA